MTNATHPAPTTTACVCCPAACLDATSPRYMCECSCRGAHHGANVRPLMPTTKVRAPRDPFADFAAAAARDADSDAAFGLDRPLVRAVVVTGMSADDLPF